MHLLYILILCHLGEGNTTEVSVLQFFLRHALEKIKPFLISDSENLEAVYMALPSCLRQLYQLN